MAVIAEICRAVEGRRPANSSPPSSGR